MIHASPRSAEDVTGRGSDEVEEHGYFPPFSPDRILHPTGPGEDRQRLLEVSSQDDGSRGILEGAESIMEIEGGNRYGMSRFKHMIRPCQLRPEG